MPHVSRKKLSEETLKQILQTFLFVLTDINNKEAMGQFLDSLLSKTEKVMLAKRLAMVYLLSEGVEETKIANILNLTQSTVSLMKLRFETKTSGYEQALIKIRKMKMLNQLKDLAFKVAKYSVRARGGRL